MDIRRVLGDATSPVEVTPLSIIVQSNYLPIWNCEAARNLVAIKWAQYGRVRFWREAVPYLLLVTLMVGKT